MSRWRKFLCWIDWHDYPDDEEFDSPMHFHTYTCRHCGQKFEL